MSTTVRTAWSLTALALAVGPLAARGEDWPRFRGPNGSGIAEAAGLPTDLAPAQALWQTPVPFGHSSPIVVGGSVFLTALDGDALATIAIDASTGAERWRRTVPRLRVDALMSESGPAVASPASDGRAVFAFFPEFGLIAYDLTGHERWRRELPPFDSYYGMAASPIVEGDVLVLLCDQSRHPFILGIDTATGSELWRQDREVPAESWTTPVVQRSGTASAAILVFGTYYLDAYAVRTGERLWRLPGFGFTPVASPVLDGDRLYTVVPDQSQGVPSVETTFALDADGDGRLTAQEMTSSPFAGAFPWLDMDTDGFVSRQEYAQQSAGLASPDWGLVAVDLGSTPPRIEWRQRKSLPYIPTPIVHSGVLFLIRDGGILTSYDPRTGEVLRQGRIAGAVEPFSPSPVAAGGRLYLASTSGTVAVVAARADWRTVAVSDLDEPIYASPAIGGGRLFVRTRSKLYAFGPKG
jgi:outer membrane protein assembly factor BamB